jgi:hypothetical protein
MAHAFEEADSQNVEKRNDGIFQLQGCVYVKLNSLMSAM